MNDVLIRPRDPLIFRDARPFSAEPGARAESLGWPLPGTFAGALRSLYGNTIDPGWPKGQVTEVLKLETQGPFLIARRESNDPWTLFAAAPRDAVPYIDPDITIAPGMDAKDAHRLMVLRPKEPRGGAGVTRTASRDEPWPMDVDKDIKPDGGLVFWSYGDIVNWLSSPDKTEWEAKRGVRGRPDWAMGQIARETRTHVAIDPTHRTAKDGALFSTIALSFRDAPGKDDDEPETAMLCRFNHPEKVGWKPNTRLIPLGGERRLAALVDEAGPDLKKGLPQILTALVGQTKLRLLLLSPAIFKDGWKPGWLTTGRDQPEALSGLNLTLKGAAVDRRIPVSGWDMDKKEEKATRYAVPAGSVYFFEAAAPLEQAQIEALWFGSVSDKPNDRNDGYGVALPGVWS